MAPNLHSISTGNGKARQQMASNLDTLLARHVLASTDLRGHQLVAQREMARRDAIEAEARQAGMHKRSWDLGSIGRSLLACGLVTIAAHFASIAA